MVYSPFPSGSPVLLKFLFSGFTTLSPRQRFFLQRQHFICHPVLSYSWVYSHQVPVSLTRYYGRSCNIASASRPCMCSYYSSSPPAPFRYRRHRAVCIVWCTLGPASASRDVRARCIFRWVVRCVPEPCTRALYAEIIPPGEEARWYGLFSIADKVCICICPVCKAE